MSRDDVARSRAPRASGTDAQVNDRAAPESPRDRDQCDHFTMNAYRSSRDANESNSMFSNIAHFIAMCRRVTTRAKTTLISKYTFLETEMVKDYFRTVSQI